MAKALQWWATFLRQVGIDLSYYGAFEAGVLQDAQSKANELKDSDGAMRGGRCSWLLSVEKLHYGPECEHWYFEYHRLDDLVGDFWRLVEQPKLL